jgi:hypothetical protein
MALLEDRSHAEIWLFDIMVDGGCVVEYWVILYFYANE